MPIEGASRLKVIASACVKLGEKPPTSESDDRYGVQVGLNLFERTYENELAATLWRFALKKVTLSQDVAVPLNEYSYQYTLPADMVMAVAVYPRGVNYQIVGDKLYSNTSGLALDYIYKPDVGLGKTPPYFYELLVARMTLEMALPLTGSLEKKESARRDYVYQLGRAQWADAQGRPNIAVQSSPFTEVR